jgi:hypothetical protein
MVKPVPKPSADREGNKGIGGTRGGNPAKRSGTYFEDSVAEWFDELPGVTAKRVYGSGAFGTMSREPRLMGDVYIRWDQLDKPIIAECKFGYGGKTQLTVKKEWVDKIVEEALAAGRYPALIFKFKGARGGNSKMICFTWDTWKEMMGYFDSKVRSLVEMISYFDNRIHDLEVENEKLRTGCSGL